MSFGTPVICTIAGRIVDKSDANFTEMPRAPRRATAVSRIDFCRNDFPISYANGIFLMCMRELSQFIIVFVDALAKNALANSISKMDRSVVRKS